MTREVILYAGPSTFGVDAAALLHDGVRLEPPVRRGDIDRLRERTPAPGVVVVCDGVFHSEPAVSHAELCRALDAGWEVWGVSSIGAIRAFELRDEGMRGFGYVYRQFERYSDFTDDEMGLLHYPEPPYFPLSEALVNVRFAFEHAQVATAVPADARAFVLDALSRMWFGDRTVAAILRLMIEGARIDAATTEALLDWLAGHRVKTLDLVSLMTERPWQR